MFLSVTQENNFEDEVTIHQENEKKIMEDCVNCKFKENGERNTKSLNTTDGKRMSIGGAVTLICRFLNQKKVHIAKLYEIFFNL